MSLTPSQASTLKTAIQGDSSVAAMVAAKDANGIATNYNGPSATQVWNKNFRADLLMSCVNPVDWAALSTGSQLAVMAALSAGFVDTTQVGIQNWFAGIFTGAADTKGTLAALTSGAKRTATKLEALFVTNGVSALDGYALSGQDVASAMGW